LMVQIHLIRYMLPHYGFVLSNVVFDEK
jgi:hypothetical protein